MARGLTAVITCKSGVDDGSSINQDSFGFMQFMVDCAVILNHSLVMGVSQRNLRVRKFRGTNFDENQAPFVISNSGVDVAVVRTLGPMDIRVTHERASSGLDRQ